MYKKNRIANGKAHLFLFITEAGDYFFIASVAIYLLSIGYSAFLTSTFIALTIIPNLVLGPLLGKFVDRSNKSILLIFSALAISLFEILLLYTTGWFGGDGSQAIVPFLFIILALLYTPYHLLVWHYFVPLIHEKEMIAYSHAEITSSLAAFFASITAAILLFYIDPGWLILIDAASFMISAIFIGALLKNVSKNNLIITKESIALKAVITKICKTRVLLFAVIGMCFFAFTIEALVQNLVPIGSRVLEVKYAYLAGIVAYGALFELIGAVLWNKIKGKIKLEYRAIQIVFFSMLAIALVTFYIGLSINSLPLLLAITALIFILTPIWDINNTVELRKHIEKNTYGTYLGVIRMPRSLITFLGIGLMAAMIDFAFFNYYILFLAALVALIAAITWFGLGKSKTSKLN